MTMMFVIVMAPALVLSDDWKVLPWVGLRVLVCTTLGLSDGRELGVDEGFERLGACVVTLEEVTEVVEETSVGLFEGLRVFEVGM